MDAARRRRCAGWLLVVVAWFGVGAMSSATADGATSARPADTLCPEQPAGSPCVKVAIDPRHGPSGTTVTVRGQADGCGADTPTATMAYFPAGGALDAANFYFIANGDPQILATFPISERVEQTVVVDDSQSPAPAFWVRCGDTPVLSFDNFTIDVPATPDPAGATPTAAATDPGTLVDPGAGQATPGPGVRKVHALPGLPASLRGPGDVSTKVAVAAANLLLAAMILLLVFPSELFNATLEEHYDEVMGWLRAPRRVLARATGTSTKGRAWTAFAGVSAVAAVLYGFLDPHIGFDAATAALVVGVGLSIVTSVLLGGLVSRRFVRRRPGDGEQQQLRLRVYPASLAVAAICVLVSRLAGFQPGYLYGIVAGFVFTAAATREDEGRRSALIGVAGLTMSVLAWLLWVPVRDFVADGHRGFALLVLDTFLAALFVGGLQSVVFGFVPLRFLPGAKVWAWSKPIWLALFGVATFGLLQVLLHPDSSYHGSAVSLVVLFVAFSAVSAGFWAYFRFRRPRPAADVDLQEPAGGPCGTRFEL